jgi:hypothetical protein
MLEILAKWWTKKYNLPWNHDLFQDRTLFDLMVEFQLDYFENNPLEAHRNEDGHIQFKNTGDDLIDKWEQQVARGETPSMSQDMFDDETLAKIERLRARGRARTGIGGTFKDVYDEVERDARQQGLSVPSSTVSLPRGSPPSRWHRSNFGDGTDN